MRSMILAVALVASLLSGPSCAGWFFETAVAQQAQAACNCGDDCQCCDACPCKHSKPTAAPSPGPAVLYNVWQTRNVCRGGVCRPERYLLRQEWRRPVGEKWQVLQGQLWKDLP